MLLTNEIVRMRKCWNWQTGKTKDLVSDTTCGFKSHLPQVKSLVNTGLFLFMHRDAERNYATKAARVQRASREKINLLYSMFAQHGRTLMGESP